MMNKAWKEKRKENISNMIYFPSKIWLLKFDGFVDINQILDRTWWQLSTTTTLKIIILNQQKYIALTITVKWLTMVHAHWKTNTLYHVLKNIYISII